MKAAVIAGFACCLAIPAMAIEPVGAPRDRVITREIASAPSWHNPCHPVYADRYCVVPIGSGGNNAFVTIQQGQIDNRGHAYGPGHGYAPHGRHGRMLHAPRDREAYLYPPPDFYEETYVHPQASAYAVPPLYGVPAEVYLAPTPGSREPGRQVIINGGVPAWRHAR